MNTKEIATEYRLRQWTGLIQTRIEAGETIEQFCEKRGLSRYAYFYWQRKVREACAQLASEQLYSVQTNGFAEVVAAETGTSSAPIQMEYKGIQICIDGTYPVAKLAALIREVVGR